MSARYPKRRPVAFGLDVALGNVSGYYKVNKFGQALDCDSGVLTDIWDGADGVTSTDIWVGPTVPRVHAIVSSSDLDSDTGGSNPQSTGMRTVQVYGLADWDTAESSEIVVLDGTASVNTGSSYVIIHRIKGLTFGSGGINAGIVKATAASDATITAVIQVGEGQTQMLIYGIPSTQTIHLTRLTALVIGAAAAATMQAELLVMENAGQADAGWLVKEKFSFTEALHHMGEWDPPKSFTGPCIIKLQVSSSANNAIAIGNFDAYIVDN